MTKAAKHNKVFIGLFTDVGGKPRFNMQGANRKIILASEAYNRVSDRDLAADKLRQTLACEVVFIDGQGTDSFRSPDMNIVMAARANKREQAAKPAGAKRSGPQAKWPFPG